MELFQLRYFTSVARTGSFSEAARLCHVSQPSLSAQIRLLEEDLGRKLFERSVKGATLTPAGRRLLRTAEQMRRQELDLRGDLRRETHLEPARLSLAVQPMLAAAVLPRALQACLKEDPDLIVAVRERHQGACLDAVVQGEVEGALVALPPDLPAPLVSRPLFTSRMMAVLPRRHRLARAARLRGSDLRDQPLLVLSGPLALEDFWGRGRRQHADDRLVCATDQALTALELCAHGLGIALVPDLLSAQASRLGLAAVPLLGPRVAFKCGLVQRSAAPPSPAWARLAVSLERMR